MVVEGIWLTEDDGDVDEEEDEVDKVAFAGEEGGGHFGIKTRFSFRVGGVDEFVLSE